jgi:hypothetical protein
MGRGIFTVVQCVFFAVAFAILSSVCSQELKPCFANSWAWRGAVTVVLWLDVDDVADFARPADEAGTFGTLGVHDPVRHGSALQRI